MVQQLWTCSGPGKLQRSGWDSRPIPGTAGCAALWWPQSATAYTSITRMWSRMPGPACQQQKATLGISQLVGTIVLSQARNNEPVKGSVLGHHVVVPYHSAFSPSTSLHTSHPENTFGQDRGCSHAATILCLIITGFLTEGFFSAWKNKTVVLAFVRSVAPLRICTYSYNLSYNFGKVMGLLKPVQDAEGRTMNTSLTNMFFG